MQRKKYNVFGHKKGTRKKEGESYKVIDVYAVDRKGARKQSSKRGVTADYIGLVHTKKMKKARKKRSGRKC